MNESKLTKIGIISTTHGYKGGLTLKVDRQFFKEDFKDLESFFIELKDGIIPFFVEELSLGNKNKLYLKFEDVNSKESAQSIVNKLVYIDAWNEESGDTKLIAYDNYIGYAVIDKQFGELGQLEQVITTTGQTVLQITADNKEDVLLPVADEIILDIDTNKKEILVAAPDGLIELYRG